MNLKQDKLDQYSQVNQEPTEIKITVCVYMCRCNVHVLIDKLKLNTLPTKYDYLIRNAFETIRYQFLVSIIG